LISSILIIATIKYILPAEKSIKKALSEDRALNPP